jgi:hypothetical protein
LPPGAERAGVQQFLEVVESGQFNPAAYNLRSQTGFYQADNLLDVGKARSTHAAYLRYLTELVEIAKLPPEQQAERLGRPGLKAPRGAPPLLEGLMRGEDCRRLAVQYHGSRALLRCAATAVAAERYRRARRRWPDSLDALVPLHLARVPDNPFDGRPVLYRRLGNGVVIEAPPPGGKDLGGGLGGRGAEGSSTPISVRLWDPERRRQPPGGAEVPAGPGKR